MDGSNINLVESCVHDPCPDVKLACNCESIHQSDDIPSLDVTEIPSKPHEHVEIYNTPNNCASANGQQQQSNDRKLDANFKFDIAKITDDVKMRIRQRKANKKSAVIQFQNQSFCLNKLFGETHFSAEEKTKVEKQEIKTTKHGASSDESDQDLFGLQMLFEKSNWKKKRNKKKVTKLAKPRKNKKSENETFGLEWLFNENSSTRWKRKVQETSHSEDGKEIIKKKKPNYFVAIRVSNPQIHAMAKDFQDSILKENAKLKPALIPLPSLHLTMAVMFLDEMSTEAAKSALQKSMNKIKNIIQCIHFKLEFSGVGNFQHEVVFAKIKNEEQLESLQAVNNIITAAFEDEGITVDNNKEWKAHLTLLKVSRKPKLRKKGIKKINEELYASWNDSYFGEEQVTNMYLCSMFEPKEKDGFYKCTATISFTETSDFNINVPQESSIDT